MKDPKTGGEINGTIGQKEICPWFPGFRIAGQFSVQADILGLSLPVCRQWCSKEARKP